MYWGSINKNHHGKKAKVWADSTPQHPTSGDGPYVGRIICKEPDCVPMLMTGKREVQFFTHWWQVELIE